MMSLVSRHFFRITITLLIYTLASLSAFAALALAQAPAPFEIRVVPQAEYAVAGQPFTYTVVITNVSQAPVKDVIVFMETPAGTTFASASQNPDWFTSGLDLGGTGKVGWATLEPITPGTVVAFELGVNVLPEMADKHLVSDQYAIVSLGGDDIIAAGLPIKTQVLATPPTATPVPSPTVAATNTATPTATPAATSTPLPTPTDAVTPVPVTISQADTVSEAATSSSMTILAVIGLPIFIIVITGLTWFLRRR
jgi:uncharacterized repeat protein (TIGR01451 family)